MGEAKKILYAAAGLILTVSLIFIGFGLFRQAKETSDIIKERQQDRITALRESDITKYDGINITGSTAVTYIKTIYEDIPTNDTNGIFITLKDGRKIKADAADFKDYKNSASNKYIAPLFMYSVAVIRDANGVIVKVNISYVSG